jgi:hypothetical protein
VARMRKLLTPLSCIACAAALGAAPAQAAPAKRCGNAGTMYNGELTLANVTARNTTCAKARQFARSFTRDSGEESGYTCSEDFYCTWRGWQCRNDGRSGPVKHRCETVNTKTHKVIVVTWVDRPR